MGIFVASMIVYMLLVLVYAGSRLIGYEPVIAAQMTTGITFYSFALLSSIALTLSTGICPVGRRREVVGVVVISLCLFYLALYLWHQLFSVIATNLVFLALTTFFLVPIMTTSFFKLNFFLRDMGIVYKRAST